MLKQYKVYPTPSDSGLTPFHLACKDNNLEIMQYFLVEMNTNINECKDTPAPGKDGIITALCLAIQNGAFEAAHFLIDRGAKVTPYTFYVAMKHNNEKLISAIVGKLREQGMGDYNLKEAVYNGRFERSESTPIMRACKYGCVQNVKMLFENLSAITDIANKNDETCLYIAVRAKQIEAVRYIC